AKAKQEFETQLLKTLKPEQGGFVFESVRSQGLSASTRGTDFGTLFLSFSFFLIVAALLLVSLLFRLNLDRRASEIGLLLASGYRHGTVRILLIAEGFIVALVGSLAGLLIGLGYADLLLDFLKSLWPTSYSLSFLSLHVTSLSLVIGLFAALIMSELTLLWGVRVLRRVPATALLQGETSIQEAPSERKRTRWSPRVAIGSLILAIILTGAGLFAKGHEERASTFLGSGACLLTAGLAVLWAGMR